MRACSPKIWQVVRRQDEGFRWYRCSQLGERGEKAGERIAIGFVGLDADIGRDFGQHLIAGDQHPDLRAIKTGELGCMAFADDHPPLSSTDFDGHPVGQPLKTRRHRGNTAAIALFPLAEELDRRRVEPGTAGEVAARGGEIIITAAHHAGKQPFFFADPQGSLPALGQPAGEPDMVGVVVGDNHPRNR